MTGSCLPGAGPSGLRRSRPASSVDPRRLKQLAAFGFWASVALIVVLSWTPRGAVPRTGVPGPVEHILAYACTGIFAGLSTARGKGRWFGLALVSLAAILEVGQLWVPGRMAQIIDFSASSAGGVVGLAAASWVTGLGFRPFRPEPATAEPTLAAGTVLLALLVLGLALAPVWIGFLVWLAGRGLAWVFG